MSDASYEPNNEDVRIIREWLQKMPHLLQDYDDSFLKIFIKGCKGRLEKTKTVLENFNAVGVKYPDFYGHLDILDKKTQTHLRNARIFLLPKTLKNGSSVVFGSLDINNNNHDPYEIHMHELFRYLHMIYYVTVWEQTAKDKLSLILDWRTMVISDFREVTPMYLKTCFEVIEKSMPMRLQAIHNIYVPPVLEYFLNLAKSLAPKKKISDRIFFHSNMGSFFESVPQELLPKDYGGKEDTIDELHAQWKKKV